MIRRGRPGVIILGRFYVGPTRQPIGGPLIDGCRTDCHKDDGTVTRLAGLVVQPRSTSTRAFAFATTFTTHVPAPSSWRWMPKSWTVMRG